MVQRRLVVLSVTVASLAVVMVVFSSSILAGNLSSNEEFDDEVAWQMFRGGPRRSGASVAGDGPRTGRLLWDVSLGPISSSPAIAEEKVFAGTLDGRFVALDLQNGGIIWEVDLNAPIVSSPAYDGGRIFFGTLQERLIRQSGARQGLEGLGSGLFALSSRDGSIIWVYETNSSIYSSPLISEGYLVFGTADGQIVVLNPDNGIPRWIREISGQILASPAADNRDMYVSSDDGILYSFDLVSGSNNWKVDFDVPGWTSSPALTERFVIISTFDGKVSAIERETGGIVWSYELGDAVLSSPLIIDDTVVISSKDQIVYGLRLATGELRWTAEVGGEIWSSPSSAGGIIYFGSLDGKVYALDIITSAVLWDFKTLDFIDSSPAIAQKTMIIGGRDGHLYAFRDQ